ncbi:MAG: tRNA (adenosine(37)-N6)-threonylcarbamoyltransferase complex dimerization subunit type 1 TsaB [Bacteroidales bacterium]
MTNILLLETATSVCSVGISRNGELLAMRESFDMRSHSGLVSVFISEVMEECGLKYTDLDAVAVSKGPGSYTGLRIGVSTAKGICYGADKPLIALETLTGMAKGFIENFSGKLHADDLLCPMIDARRMEVYTSFYNIHGNKKADTTALIIDLDAFSDLLEKGRIWFFGDGADKCENVLTHPNALIVKDFHPSVRSMTALSQTAFENQQFENVAYFEPYYLKDFVAALPKVKGLH